MNKFWRFIYRFSGLDKEHEAELRRLNLNIKILHESIIEQDSKHQSELQEFYRRGRDFEFKTMNNHCEAFYKKKLSNSEIDQLAKLREP